MRILKFGGSSLAEPERVRRVVDIVRDAQSSGPVAVVVSAFGGVTDELLAGAQAAEARDEVWRELVAGLEERHVTAMRELAGAGEAGSLEARIRDDFADLRELVHGVSMVREASPRTMDRILSTGERLSARTVAAALRDAGIEAVDRDARELIVTGPEFGAARVIEEPTRERIRASFADGGPLAVVTGFIAATEQGETTTLGRGGSDYTASLLGAALDATAVELWTDVDGVLSADPRIVPDAILAARLGYDELMELSHFGAKVVHPPSVHPTRSCGIPLVIRNTFRPDAPGTTISAHPAGGEGEEGGDSPVRGIASFGPVTLFRLEGDGMVGVPGIAMRLFGALARRGVSVILITQASSEHSICFAVSPDSAGEAIRGVEEEFEGERRGGLIDELVGETDLAVVAIVGEGMRDRSGVAGRIFEALGHRSVNVRAVAQGSSERNISLVVRRTDEARAVRAVHDAFFLGGARDLDVVVAGVGQVGRALLSQFAARREALEKDRGIRLRLLGVAGSQGARLDIGGLDPAVAAEGMQEAAELVPLESMLELVETDPGVRRVFVDCQNDIKETARRLGAQQSDLRNLLGP